MDIFIIGLMLASSVLGQPPAENKTCYQGNQKTAAECCPLPRMMEKSIADMCNSKYKALSPRVPPGVRKTEGSCVTQCIFTTIGGYNEKNNTLNIEAIRKAILTTTANAKAFLPLLNSSIDHCYPIISKDPQFLATPVSPIPEREGCSFLPPALMNCIKIDLFQNCPQKKWNNATECQRLNEKITTGCSFSSIVSG
ncbi:general odorant-binding protein 67 [Aedes aegypti]|uniref:OBP47-like domain-containing protein n=1 Tax=Aedes aegypti TaxID=7159 RepID=A0A6I8TVW0_AEDAE|nr:general odorant-binding protein 67 [Aedes aegypti]